MSHTDNTSRSIPLTNYVSYLDPRRGKPRVGHYDLNANKIQPLSFLSGTPIDDLYQVIEAGVDFIKASGDTFSRDDVKILPPITGRDVLCVGKNYAEHAKEFNSSGFDSSDKVDQPSHPVIFTKRFSSIIADGEEIYPHPHFTETIDYEGEIAAIIGKAGFRIPAKDAMDYVWGYTIVNDLTARERQRDHKQFYIGKSPDTFCPMGPIAVPAHSLPKVLSIETHVNGEERQRATTEDLIFSIPFLIQTLSEGQTLMPGDVLATGTPAGVGIGRKPPIYLQPGDDVTVSVSGLGSLRNRISSSSSTNPTIEHIRKKSYLNSSNEAQASANSILTKINNKMVHYKQLGHHSSPPIFFVHGLGGTLEYWNPLLNAAQLENTHSLHLYDLEGHGLSPTSPLSTLSIESFARDLAGVFKHANVSNSATLVAHSMGCLVALRFALDHPGKISKLILLGPPPTPLPPAASTAMYQRAETVRESGMSAVVDAIASAGTSEKTKQFNPLAVAAVRLSLLGQTPESYAKACTALADFAVLELKIQDMKADTLIITGSEDKVSPPELCQKYVENLSQSVGVKIMDGVGHWQVFEDLNGVAREISRFI